MEITVNGDSTFGDYDTVIDLLKERELDPKLVVVELNEKILPATDYAATKLKEGDTIEIVQFVAGG